MSEFDHPVAVLLSLDGSERIVPTTDPPPPVYLIPIPAPLSIHPDSEPPCYSPIQVRTFRLSRRFGSRHRWLRTYNEGRSRTPAPVPLYLEDPPPEPAPVPTEEA